MPALRSRWFLLTILLVASACQGAEMTMAWLLENRDFQETILSNNPAEKEQLLKDGWVVDGTGQMRTEWAEGSGPVYRLFRGDAQSAYRVLESDVRQLPVWEKSGFSSEGIVGYAADRDGPGRLAVIQYAKKERRLWVVSKAAQARVEQEGWTRQGVHFWLWPAAAATLGVLKPCDPFHAVEKVELKAPERDRSPVVGGS
jgi:hypothetical protein